jgi:hypothetical protein
MQVDCSIALLLRSFDSPWKMDRDIAARSVMSFRRFIASSVYLSVYYYKGKRAPPKRHHFCFLTWLYCQYLCAFRIFPFFIYSFDYIRPFGSRASSSLWLFFAVLLNRITSKYLSFFLFLLFPCVLFQSHTHKERQERIVSIPLSPQVQPGQHTVGTGKLYSMSSFDRVYSSIVTCNFSAMFNERAWTI